MPASSFEKIVFERPKEGLFSSPIKLPEFVTQVFRCDRYGIPEIDIVQILFDAEAATREEAMRNHRKAVSLFSFGSFKDLEPYTRDARARRGFGL